MRNFSILVLIFSVLGLFGCTAEDKAPLAKPVVAEELISVPKFRIEIALTNAAKQKLKQAGESIRGTVYFDGDETPLAGVKTAPLRDVYLGKYDFELSKEGSLNIEDASISQQAYTRLENENYHFFINVFSGRRVFKDNILDCDHVAGRLQNLKSAATINISCKLLLAKHAS